MSELTSGVARLSKEKDSALSKMSLWMKTCKQLEQEKQTMLNSAGVNYSLQTLDFMLWNKSKVGVMPDVE